MEKNVGYTLLYKSDMTCLFGILLDRNKNVVEAHKLFERMNDCILSRRRFEKSETPESEALARWSIERAENELRELMRAWCLLDTERNLILSLVRRTV